MEPGERWAYRAQSVDPVVEVEILRIGTSRPARVKVRFLEEAFEGREEWVPPARLKVQWDQVQPWQAREDRWTAVQAASDHIRDTDEDSAAGVVFDEVMDRGVASLGYGRSAGVLSVHDLQVLTGRYAVDPEAITSDPLSFDDGGVLMAPWRVAEQVVVAVARGHAEQLIEYMARKEAQSRQDAVYGREWSLGRGTETRHIEPEWCAAWAEEERRMHDVIRGWIGLEAQERHDELGALREEVQRLATLVEALIDRVRSLGDPKSADRFQRELGIPVEVVRAARRTADSRRTAD